MFGKNSSGPNGLHWYCKECANENARKNHAARDKSYKDSRRDRLRERAREAKSFVVEYVFGGRCYDCGESFPDCVFDFHHEGEKEANPSQLISRHNISSALDELEKCVMLCANCHRMRHFHNKDEE